MILLSFLLAPIVVSSNADINVAHLSPIDRCHSLLRNQSSFHPGKLQSLEGLVGIGWDNLINTATAPVLALTYSKCLTTPDGAYLLPDNIMAIPVQQTSFDQMAKYYDSYEAFVQQTTQTINVEAGIGFGYGFGGISGSYSTKHQDTKKTMYEHKASMLHARFRHHAYTLVADFSDGLHPGFARRLMVVAEAQARNLTLRARYLAELVIRDYGTHVITSADVGAVIERENYIDSSTESVNTTSFDELKVAVSYSVSFGWLFKAHAGASTDTTVSADTIKRLSKKTKHVIARSQGGPSPSRLATEKDNYEMDSIVALDVKGVPLHTLIYEGNLPSLSHDQFGALMSLLLNVTREYYSRNRVPGCTSRHSPNFNFNANVDDNSCTRGAGNYTFGGVYTTCTMVPSPEGNPPASQCASFIQPNFVTGQLTCDDDFQPVSMLRTVLQLPDRHEQRQKRECKHYWFITKCHNVAFDVVIKDHVTVEAFWCRPKPAGGVPKPAAHSVIFGGLFTAGHANQMTNEMGCPGRYREFPLLKTTTLCLSRDYQLDGDHAVELQRFFSCQSTKSEQGCAQGFSQHLALVVNDCEVYYCVRNEAFNKVKPQMVKRSPFTSPDAMHNNVSESSLLIYTDDQLWGTVPLSAVLLEGRQLMQVANLDQSENQSPEGLKSQAITMWIDDAMEKARKESEAMNINNNTNTPSMMTVNTAVPAGSSFSLSFGTLLGLTLVAAVVGAVVVIGGIKAFERRRQRAVQQEFYPLL